jgi:hypothetical protein
MFTYSFPQGIDQALSQWITMVDIHKEVLADLI